MGDDRRRRARRGYGSARTGSELSAVITTAGYSFIHMHNAAGEAVIPAKGDSATICPSELLKGSSIVNVNPIRIEHLR
jgi:hypothetical protein